MEEEEVKVPPQGKKKPLKRDNSSRGLRSKSDADKMQDEKFNIQTIEQKNNVVGLPLLDRLFHQAEYLYGLEF